MIKYTLTNDGHKKEATTTVTCDNCYHNLTMGPGKPRHIIRGDNLKCWLKSKKWTINKTHLCPKCTIKK